MNDPRIRDSYIRYLSEESSDYKPKQDLLISEMGLCRGTAIVDLAVINGTLHGYEIKSDVDSLTRLNRQLNIYQNFFSYLTIVTTSKHLTSIQRNYPKWLGITVAKETNGEITFITRRKPKLNKSVTSDYVVQLLWKKEALAILENHGVGKGYKSKPKAALWNKISEILNPKELIAEIKAHVANRSDWQVVHAQA